MGYTDKTGKEQTVCSVCKKTEKEISSEFVVDKTYDLFLCKPCFDELQKALKGIGGK